MLCLTFNELWSDAAHVDLLLSLRTCTTPNSSCRNLIEAFFCSVNEMPHFHGSRGCATSKTGQRNVSSLSLKVLGLSPNEVNLDGSCDVKNRC